jgi:two-component system response regulator HupR/HoxA
MLARLDGGIGTSGPPLEVAKEALEAFLKYAWPGNVRELENELKRLVALGVRKIKLSDLAPRILAPPTANPTSETSASSAGDLPTLNLRQVERLAIEKALQDAGGNKTQAAKVLGLSRRGLLKKLERYKIESGPEETAETVIESLLDSEDKDEPSEDEG